MKTIRILVLIFAALMATAADADDHVLRVYNWENQLLPELVTEFESWYKDLTGETVKVEARIFDQPEDVLERIESGEERVDAFCPPEYIVERMLRHALLQKIDTAYSTTGTPNWTDGTSPFIDGTLQRIGDTHGVRMKDYTVGYIWGNTGVLVNRKYVSPEEVSSWGCLFDPKFKGRIWVKDSHSDFYNILICYAMCDDIRQGLVSRNMLASGMSNENIAIVGDRMHDMTAQVAGFEVGEGMDHMAAGDWWMNVTWNGDAEAAMQDAAEGVELAYVVPEEGSDCWIDCWVIPTCSGNVRAASYLINFLCKPENALRTIQGTGNVMSVANPMILEALTDPSLPPSDLSYFFGEEAKAVRVNNVMYPDASVISRCCLLRDSGDRQEVMREMWNRWKQEVEAPKWTRIAIWVLVVGMLLAAAVIVVRRLRCRASRRGRGSSL